LRGRFGSRIYKAGRMDQPIQGAEPHRPEPSGAAGISMVWDYVVVSVLGVWVLITEARHFFSHNWVAIPWGDWAMHAYRARFLTKWGLTTWDPSWDMGFPLFQAYQILPHASAALLSRYLPNGVPQAMMVLTGILLLFYVLSTYVVLRRLGCGVFGSVLATALVVDNADIGPPLKDYSYFFGMAFVPAMFYFSVKGFGNRNGYLGALLFGTSVYLHPYATFAAGAALAARWAYERFKINRRMVHQGFIVLLVSSFNWIPYFFNAQPAYIDPWNWSVDFARQLFPRIGLFGFSIGFIVLMVGTLTAFIGRKPRNGVVVVSGLGGSAIMGAMAALAYYDLLPDPIMAIEPTRWMPLIGTLGAFAVAPFGDWLAERVLRQGSRHLWVRPTALAALTTVVVGILFEGYSWFRSNEVPFADHVDYERNLKAWADSRPDIPRPIMAWTNTNDIAYTSYAAMGYFHFPGDYIVTRQWTVASPLLYWALQSNESWAPAQTGDFTGIERYLRMFGVEYLMMNKYLPANVSFIHGSLNGRLEIVAEVPDGWITRVPWHPVKAFVAPLEEIRKTNLPDLRFLTHEEIQLRDRKVDEYNRLKHSSLGSPAEVRWHHPTRLSVGVEARPGYGLVIQQNWDTVWEARVGGKILPTERVGPNFLGVRLEGVEGPVTVDIRHGFYPTWTISLIFSVSGIILAATAFVSTRRRTIRPIRRLGP
jgi:hypothetical protein